MLESYDIHIIKTISDNGSLSKAAEQLCMSQSTLSKRLSRLEATLGLELFYRHNGGMKPTPAANYMIAEGEQIRGQLSSIDRHVKQLGTLASGEINIGIGPIIEQIFFPELLLKYAAVTDNIRIKITTGSTERLTRLLHIGEIDLALGPFNPTELDENLICSNITQDKIVLVAQSEHPIFSCNPQGDLKILIDELLKYPSIGPEIPSKMRHSASVALLDNLPSIICHNYNISKSMALQSNYITGGPQVLFEEEIKAGKLTIITGLPDPIIWQSYLITKPESLQVPAVNAFIQVVKDTN